MVTWQVQRQCSNLSVDPTEQMCVKGTCPAWICPCVELKMSLAGEVHKALIGPRDNESRQFKRVLRE